MKLCTDCRHPIAECTCHDPQGKRAPAATSQLPPSQPAATPETPKIITAHVYPPIPTRAFDWIAYFDGHEEGSYGSGATEESAIADLMANNEAVDRSLQHDFMSDLPDPMAARKVSGITCNHLPRLTIASNEGGYICCECWALGEEQERKAMLKLMMDVRESIACFLPTDCNIMERPTLDALNQVFREVIATRRQRDEARKELAEAKAEWEQSRKLALAAQSETKKALAKADEANLEASNYYVQLESLRAQLSTVTKEMQGQIAADVRRFEASEEERNEIIEILKVVENARDKRTAERDTALAERNKAVSDWATVVCERNNLLATIFRDGGQRTLQLGNKATEEGIKTVAELLAVCQRLREALEFYADPTTYTGILFIGDQPCGDFQHDISETEMGKKPGATARRALNPPKP